MDLRLYNNAHYLQNFQRIAPSNDLNQRVSLQAVRILTQIRLASKFYCHLTINGYLHKLYYNEKCPICNTREPDSIEHLLIGCPINEQFRKYFLIPAFNSPLTISTVLNSNKKDLIKAIYYFEINSCPLRAFCLNK